MFFFDSSLLLVSKGSRFILLLTVTSRDRNAQCAVHQSQRLQLFEIHACIRGATAVRQCQLHSWSKIPFSIMESPTTAASDTHQPYRITFGLQSVQRQAFTADRLSSLPIKESLSSPWAVPRRLGYNSSHRFDQQTSLTSKQPVHDSDLSPAIGLLGFGYS